MAHLDVVPVEGEWQHGAFSGDIADGSIWGRGTLDDKGQLVAVCEAVELLLETGHTPAQDVWLSFGCDEEVFGQAAPMAVEELRSSGVQPWVVIDEGGAIASDAFPGSEQAGRRRRRDREGRHVHRAHRRGPRRPRVDPDQARPDRTAGEGDHPARQRADAGQRPRADPRAVPAAGTARVARDAAADGQREQARPGPAPRPGPRRTGDRGDDPHDLRGHHAAAAHRRST